MGPDALLLRRTAYGKEANMIEEFETRNPDYRRRVEDSFGDAPFVEHLGIARGDFGLGWCEAMMPLDQFHLQQNGVVHGGAVATLADHTAGSAGTSLIATDEIVLSIGYAIHLLRPGSGNALRCRSEVVRNGSRLIVVQSDVFAENNGRKAHIARATVTLAVVPREHVEQRE